MIRADAIRYLMTATGHGGAEARNALVRQDGNLYRAEGWLKFQGLAINCGSQEAYDAWVELRVAGFARRREIENGGAVKVEM